MCYGVLRSLRCVTVCYGVYDVLRCVTVCRLNREEGQAVIDTVRELSVQHDANNILIL